MTYTRKQFGIELKEKIDHKELVSKIGEWSHSVYLQHIDDIDLEFRDILLMLNTMELGPEFAYGYEELLEIADALISGKPVKL